MKQFIENLIYVQVKRLITLAVGVAVGAGVFTATEGDAQATAITAVLSQFVLSVFYWAYDKYVKDNLLKLLGLAVKDAVAK